MNTRALISTDVLLGIVPIALAGRRMAGDLVIRLCARDAAAAAWSGVHAAGAAARYRARSSMQIAATLFRLFAGFSIAVILGVGIGLAAAASPAVNAVVRPIVRVLAPLPKVALYPALLLLLGFGHESKITLVAADALFPILLSTYYGASMVEQKLIWSAMAAGTPRHQILFKVVLPAAVPSILTGCRIGLVISCIVVFLAEMITSTEGLGHLLVTAARTFQAVDMFVPLITISLLGLILNAPAAGASVVSAARVSRKCEAILEVETDHAGGSHRSKMDRRILRGFRALRGQAGRHRRNSVGDAVARAQRSSRRTRAVADGRQAVSHRRADSPQP